MRSECWGGGVRIITAPGNLANASGNLFAPLLMDV